MIARKRPDVRTDSLETHPLPRGTYAAFRTGCGGLAWEEFPKLFEQIFNSWLPASGFRLKSDLCIEVLHLWTDRELRRRNRYNEVWIPVEPKQQDGHEATESCLPFRHTGGTMASR